MSIISQAVSSISVTASISPSAVNSLVYNTSPWSTVAKLANLTNYEVLTGTFTPNNNTYTIPLSAVGPNFFIFACDQPAVVGTNDSNLTLYTYCCNKFVMGTLSPGLPISGFTIYGETSRPIPMAQGVPCNYTLIVGQADIS